LNLNRKFLIAGIVVLFFTNGFSGCIDEEVDESQENVSISLEKIENHIDIYLGKEITTEGYVGKGSGDNMGSSYITDLCSSNSPNPKYCVLINVPVNVTIYEGMYKITGIMGKHEITSIPVINVTSASLISKKLINLTNYS